MAPTWRAVKGSQAWPSENAWPPEKAWVSSSATPVKSRSRNTPPTPPPPPLEEPEAELKDAASEEPGLFYVRKTIDATEWEAAISKDASKPAHQVLVSGFPNKLLGDLMFNAILEQSGISEAVQHFKASPGQGTENGQVLIALDSAEWAVWCACHFHNRKWGDSTVYAEVLPNWDNQPPEWPIDDSVVDTRLAPDAPEFVPFRLWRDNPLPPSEATYISGRSWLEEATASLEKERRTRTNSSNASTRDDGSESGDEVSKVGSVGAYSPG